MKKWVIAIIVTFLLASALLLWNISASPEAVQRQHDEWRDIRQQGSDACADAIPAEACQHAGYRRQLWMEGWQQYRREHPLNLKTEK